MATSIYDQLTKASDRNAALLHALSESAYAPPALIQQKATIKDLETHISSTSHLLSQLELRTKSELKDHQKYADSKIRRFAHGLGGSKGKQRFAEKAEKEERAFTEAWQKERETRDCKDDLERQLREARETESGLEEETSRNEQAQRELDELYEGIFAGPTPEFPEEDVREENVEGAKAQYGDVERQLGMEKHALECLEGARTTYGHALKAVQSALSMSRMDMFGGGIVTDMLERNALSQCQTLVSRMEREVEDARRIQPAIGSLGSVEVAHGSIVSDVLFDNIFTDMAFHGKIQNTDTQLRWAGERLEEELSAARQRLVELTTKQDQAGDILKRAKQQLQRVRSEAFQTPAGAAPSYEAAPAYQATGSDTRDMSEKSVIGT